MEEAFTRVVQHIFNNWSALKLAVDHSMGGPQSQQTAIDCMNYMVQYCLYENNVDVDKIQEALEDLLDEEFETVCEDGSPKEIATVLFRFVQLIVEGNFDQCEIEYQKLPIMNTNWLDQNRTDVQVGNNSQTSSDEEDNDSGNVPPETPMEDDGWTQVKSRRKR